MTLKNRRGLSIMEMTVYIALVGIIAMIIAGILAAGEKSYTLSARQTSVLMWSRQALEGGGLPHGIIWESRQAQLATSLSATSLGLTTPDAAAPQFTLSGTTMKTVQKAVSKTVAQNVTSLQLSYYNLNSAGRIIVSTSPALATMITAQIQIQGVGTKKYTFYTGAQLRNHS